VRPTAYNTLIMDVWETLMETGITVEEVCAQGIFSGHNDSYFFLYNIKESPLTSMLINTSHHPSLP